MKRARGGWRGLVLGLAGLAMSACNEGWWGPLPADRRAIVQRYGKWQQALREERLADAYAFMTPLYREDHTLEAFAERFSSWGSEHSLEPDCYMRGTRTYAYVHPYELGFSELMNGPLAEWEKIDGTWMFTGEVDWFVD